MKRLYDWILPDDMWKSFELDSTMFFGLKTDSGSLVLEWVGNYEEYWWRYDWWKRRENQ